MKKFYYKMNRLIVLFVFVFLAFYYSNFANTNKSSIDSVSETSIQKPVEISDTIEQVNTSPFNLADIPEFSDKAYISVNNGIPYFTDDELTTTAFETYSELDNLGRCGIAYANICKELMPTEKRGNISEVKPSGWQSIKMNSVDGGWLYNRCHLIGFQLAGENANKLNLITGTRYLNIEGMLPFENMIADYVKETNHHVLYRVSPIFKDNELVARGVLMEGKSVEDDEIEFCVFAYNTQPGISINYKTGEIY